MRLRTRPIAAVADGVVGGGAVEPRLELPLGVSGEGGDQLDDPDRALLATQSEQPHRRRR